MNYHKYMDNKFSILLDNAYNMHVSGNLVEAKNIYDQLLLINPESADVLNLLAQLYVSLKEYDNAIDTFNKAFKITQIIDIKISIAKVFIYKGEYNSAIKELDSIEVKDNNIINLLAFIYMKKSDYINAIKYYKKLIVRDNSNFVALYNISLCFSYLNKFEDSIKYALKALDKNSNDIDLLLHLSYLYESLNDKDKSLIYLKKASEISKNPNILYRIAVLYKQLKNYNESAKYFEEVLQLVPNRKDALVSLASVYKYIDKNISLSLYLKARELFPLDQNIIFSIYTAYINMLNFEEALKISLELIELDSKNSMYYSMAADSYLELFDYKNAIKYYKKSLKYNKNDDGAKCSLAYAYSCHRDTNKALDILKNLEKTPAVIQDFTIINLRRKNFKEVEDYYYNWHTDVHTVEDAAEKARKYFYKLKVGEIYGISEEAFTKFRSELPANVLNKIAYYRRKLWHKEDPTNKNILIYSSHGAGDLIMFLRYLDILSKKAKHIILTAPNSLIDIIKYNYKNIDVLKRDDNIDENSYDYSTPEMGLIYNLNMDFFNIPHADKYISVPKKLINAKSKLKIFDNDKRKIGIFWQGNPTALRNRSVKLKYFEPLLKVKNCLFYSFQLSKVDFESNDLKKDLPIIDLSSYIKNYSDTAALLKNIDLLITIDSSIAHLAGAMGIKTYLMLPYDAEWRWFYDEDKTPWYNSIKIFKQQKSNDWVSVIKRIKLELEKL